MTERHVLCFSVERIVQLKVTLAVLVFLVSHVSWAQGDDSDRDAARDHYKQGLELVAQSQFEQALEQFRAAYEASPQFAVLYNIGQTCIALGRPVEALSALEQYLGEGKAEIPAERAEQVARQIAGLKAKTAEIAVVATAGTTIELDGAEMGRAPLPAPVRVTVGAHVVSARAEDGSKLSRTVTLQAGDRLDLRLDPPTPGGTLTKPAAIAVADPKTAAERNDLYPGEARSRAPSNTTTTTLGYVVGGIGVGLAATAFGHYLWNLGRYEDWKETNAALKGHEDAPDYADRQTKNNELASSIDQASRVTVSLAVGSGALLATGVTLVVVGNGGPARDHGGNTGARLSFAGVW